jgi:two-component system response regulator HydG
VHVLQASSSLETFWPSLADELGLELAAMQAPADARGVMQGVIIVSAGGVERTVPDLLREIGRSSVPLVAVGVDESRRVAIDALRAGAAEYFCLPLEVDALRSYLRSLVAAAEAHKGLDQFVELQQRKHRFNGVFGSSPAMQQAIARAERVIPHDKLTLLITGETGTGKELFARAIHYNGPRRHHPFVAVNCAAIPQQLLESELFGHERGAFTGAHAAKPGLFEVANGGTLLLDEIGHLDIALQGKLLRALEDRAIRRVGSGKATRIDVRVLAATHVDLARAVERGEFRSDLYYRLNVVSIVLPPLRERGSDALTLADHFVHTTGTEYRVPTPTLSDGARALIARYHWPGNVRELRNAMERATLLAQGGTIRESDLEIDERRAGPLPGPIPFPASLAVIVRAAARATVAQCGGNKSEAARRLGISRSRLLRFLAADHDFAETVE